MIPILHIAEIAIEGAILLMAAQIDAVDQPLVLDMTRTWPIFARKDAMRALAALSEEDRHRLFVGGFRQMAPYAGSEATLNNMLKDDAAAIDEAFRSQWQHRCNHSIPNG